MLTIGYVVPSAYKDFESLRTVSLKIVKAVTHYTQPATLLFISLFILHRPRPGTSYNSPSSSFVALTANKAMDELQSLAKV
jgi:hypothetical protein